MPSGTPKTVFRLVIGGICFLYAGILLTNWNHAKERVLAMMTKKLWGLEHPRTRTGRFMRAVAKDVLTLLAIGWLAVGVLDLLRVVVDSQRLPERLPRSGGPVPAQEVGALTRYGTLRTWSLVLKVVGFFAVIFAIIGSIIWAFEVEGVWETLGVIFIGAPISIFLATAAIAPGQALTAIADIGDALAP